MSSLTVYKASAGSGKTFTLAVAYIKLLVANPASYRNILAVTFTNKATEEMKTRILSQLYGISRGLAESDDYLKKIALETQMAEDDIRKAASAALSLLIHNYDYFHVETIDTFFQSVLRNLARELDLSANLRVELNDTAVENQAVDLMIEELDRKSPLFSWIVRFIMENIDKNNSWNIIGSVKDFGRMIFNDQYREIGKNSPTADSSPPTAPSCEPKRSPHGKFSRKQALNSSGSSANTAYRKRISRAGREAEYRNTSTDWPKTTSATGISYRRPWQTAWKAKRTGLRKPTKTATS